MIAVNTAALIGNTPLLKLRGYVVRHQLKCAITAKLEYLNPFGSVKDRVARAMLDAAEQAGLISAGATIIEPTSGNTGIGLAALCAARGYKCIIVMPENMSVERQRLMRAYGAQVVLTQASGGMAASIAKARELIASADGAYMPDQFNNPANVEAHIYTTGPEIWEGMAGNIDAFVAGIGTGGTITGVAQYLKGKNGTVYAIGVEPDTSSVLTGGKPGPHKLQGIGAGFVPPLLERKLIDEVLPVSYEEALAAQRDVMETDGLLIGISAGAALAAAKRLANRREYFGGSIVTLFADGGERYLA